MRGEGGKPRSFSGYAKRIPELRGAPRLHSIVYEDPVDLLAEGMAGWEPKESNRPFFWKFEDGVLSNVGAKDKDGKRIAGANIVTKRRDFKDFKLCYDVKVP